jgi:hypothetical protein
MKNIVLSTSIFFCKKLEQTNGSKILYRGQGGRLCMKLLDKLFACLLGLGLGLYRSSNDDPD